MSKLAPPIENVVSGSDVIDEIRRHIRTLGAAAESQGEAVSVDGVPRQVQEIGSEELRDGISQARDELDQLLRRLES